MELRDNLLVTMGARAAYMHDKGYIELPEGTVGEDILAVFVAGEVEMFMNFPPKDLNFDEFIEASLMRKFGPKKANSESEHTGTFFMDANSINAITHALRTMIHNQRDSELKNVNYAVYKCIEHLENQILELERRTR